MLEAAAECANAVGANPWLPLVGVGLGGIIAWLSARSLEARRAKGKALAAAAACARRLEEVAELQRGDVELHVSVSERLLLQAEELHDHAVGETRLRRTWCWVLPALREALANGHADAEFCEAFARELRARVDDRALAEPPKAVAKAMVDARTRKAARKDEAAEQAETGLRKMWTDARASEVDTGYQLQQAAASGRLPDLLAQWRTEHFASPAAGRGHLCGLAEGCVGFGRADFDQVAEYALGILDETGTAREAAEALCRDGRHYLALPAALFLGREDWQRDKVVRERLRAYFATAPNYTTAQQRNVAVVLCAWSTLSREEAASRVREMLSDDRSAGPLLLRLVDEPGGFRFDAVMATAHERAFVEAFERLLGGRHGSGQHSDAYRAFRRAAEAH